MIFRHPQKNEQSTEARSAVPLFALLILCMLTRVVFIVFFGDTLSLETSGYDAYAVNLLNGNGYTRFDDLHPDSDLPPLYVFFLAGVYAVFGRDVRAVAVVQGVLDLITVTLVYLTGRRVFNRRTGLLAAALTALYPYMLYQDLTVNDTALFICLLMLAVYAIYRVEDMTWAAATGAVLGIAALTKSFVLLLVLLWGLWLLTRRGWRRGLLLAAVMGVVAGVVVTPWAVRNTLLHGRLVFISTNGGSNFHQGNNSCTRHYLLSGWDVQWTGDCWEPPPSGLSEVELDAWHMQRAQAYLMDDPGRAVVLFGIKALVLWSPVLTPHAVPPDVADQVGLVLQYEQPAFQLARVVHFLYFMPLLLAAVIGGWLAQRHHAPLWPLLAVFVAITFTYTLTHPSTRYRMPLDPLLFIFSAYALTWMWGKMRTWHGQT